MSCPPRSGSTSCPRRCCAWTVRTERVRCSASSTRTSPSTTSRLLNEPRHHAQLRRIAAFDLLANNGDRKGGHLLIDWEGRIWGIDHGLCFHVEAKLRTVMWDFAGRGAAGRAALRLRARRRARFPSGWRRCSSPTSVKRSGEGHGPASQTPLPFAARRLPGLSLAARVRPPQR